MRKSRKNRKSVMKSIKHSAKKVLPAVNNGLTKVGKTAKNAAAMSLPVIEKGVATVYGTMATGFNLGLKGTKGIIKGVNNMSKKMHHSKNNKKRSKNKKTKRKGKIMNGGGEWLSIDDAAVDENDKCPFCLEKFVDTPELAIYQTDCGHIFHNDCLSNICEHKHDIVLCPLCRKDLGYDCIDVYAFKNHILGTETIPPGTKRFDDEKIQKIYDAQKP